MLGLRGAQEKLQELYSDVTKSYQAPLMNPDESAVNDFFDATTGTDSDKLPRSPSS